jgi:hypothetical protein
MVVEAKFSYNGYLTSIQCKESDIMKDIIGKYVSKAKLDMKKIFFLYGGNIINNELTVKELIPNGNSINILVSEILEDENEEKMKEKKELEKSNIIVCSICKDMQI